MNHTLTTRLTFVPKEDAAAYAQLSAPVKQKAEALYEIACELARTPHKEKGSIYLAHAKALGVHVNTIAGPIRRFLKTRDWRALIDRRMEPALWLTRTDNELPHEFIEYWKTLVEQNSRCTAAAYVVLMEKLRAWRRGDITAAIPGYHTPPPNAPGYHHPHKWSERTLRRSMPTDTQLAATREGRNAALKTLPAIFTTRKGGYLGMEYQFDDMFHDIECVHGKALCRPVEYGAIEFYSGFYLPPGIKPRIKKIDAETKSEHWSDLTEKEFALYAINLFATVGYSPRGTTAQAEKAKAVFRDALGQKLSRWTNGAIKIAKPGMSGASAYSGGWAERAKGNPNAKALKEGMGKIIHNRLAALPGQLGMNPATMPAGTHGMQKDTELLIKLSGIIGTPIPTAHLKWEDVIQQIYYAYDLINRRTEHDIEGYEEEGLIIPEFHADPHNDVWINLTELDPTRRAAMEIIRHSMPHLFRIRRMSPAEVWHRDSAQLIKLMPEAEADCLYDLNRRTETANHGVISFRDAEQGLGTFRYFATYQSPDGFRRTIHNGDDIDVVINPFRPERAFYYTLRGQYLGIAQRDHSITRGDVDARNKRIGQREADYKTAVAATEYRHGLRKENHLNAATRALLDHLDGLKPTRATSAPDIPDLYSSADLPSEPTNADLPDPHALL
jgi:hypothetical protein